MRIQNQDHVRALVIPAPQEFVIAAETASHSENQDIWIFKVGGSPINTETFKITYFGDIVFLGAILLVCRKKIYRKKPYYADTR